MRTRERFERRISDSWREQGPRERVRGPGRGAKVIRISKDVPKTLSINPRRKLKIRNLDEKQVTNDDLRVIIQH
jgi:hypothetical protein